MTSVEIGLGLQSDKPAGTYGRLARRAEECGFDVLTVFGDLMYQPPIFPLLEMAAATERVRLGPACLNPYSMAPYEIAGQVAALDLASGGSTGSAYPAQWPLWTVPVRRASGSLRARRASYRLAPARRSGPL